MAPVKIKYVVSFTSQDPKYPVENLLLEEDLQPWLCCPRDRSRQLKAELQLEQASHIGYVDVGNCGCAFLQIDVGRSSWPLDQSYHTLLPTTTLMTPAEAKLDKNRSGVRMFKEGDFLALAVGEKWDRVRLTCRQPFNKHTQFGLSFIRIRTPLDTEGSKADPASSPNQAPPELTSNPWLSNAAICRTYFSEAPSSTEEEAALKTRLQQLDPASSPGTQHSACMSRPARMVLKAACARKRTFPLVADSSPLAAKSLEEGQAHSASPGPVALRSKQELPVGRNRMKTSRRGSCSNVGRSVAVSSVRPRNRPQREGKAPSQTGRLRTLEEEEEEQERWPAERDVGLGACPICAGRFPTALLPAHASGCGEEDLEASTTSASSSSSPSSWEEPAEAWVGCPICQLRFPAADVESHASGCGEQEEPSWLWVE
ncbi:protein XNDC1N [Elgaria multicarinata webbii]|uniref:protein XNDC1N n=1 Tax=Elgaria multicarinata webbii TaxID=159646 RepID=UPI002FCCD638